MRDSLPADRPAPFNRWAASPRRMGINRRFRLRGVDEDVGLVFHSDPVGAKPVPAHEEEQDARAFEPVRDLAIDRVAEPDLPPVKPDLEPVPREPLGQIANDGPFLRRVAEEDVKVERLWLVVVHSTPAPRAGRYPGASRALESPLIRTSTPPRGTAPASEWESRTEGEGRSRRNPETFLLGRPGGIVRLSGSMTKEADTPGAQTGQLASIRTTYFRSPSRGRRRSRRPRVAE